MAQVRKRQFDFPHRDAAAATPRPDLRNFRVVEGPPMPATSQSRRLTRRECQCLGWCAEGKSYWETAVILGIAERTVSFHMEAVRGKLEATSNAHAVARAMGAGLLGPCAQASQAPQQGLQ